MTYGERIEGFGTIIVPEYLTGCYPAVEWGDDGEPVEPMSCGVHEVAWTFDGCPVMT